MDECDIDLHKLSVDELLTLSDRVMVRLNELQSVRGINDGVLFNRGDRVEAKPSGQFSVTGTIEKISFTRVIWVRVKGKDQTLNVPPDSRFLRKPDPETASGQVLRFPGRLSGEG